MKVLLKKAPTDPICARVSVGGNEAMGAYCTYRGNLDACIAVMEAALNEMKHARFTGDEPGVDRRFKELGAS